MSSPPDTPASRSPTPANAQAKTTRGTFGPTSRRQFAFYDPDSSCWKTWPAISLWGSDEFSETWPRSGTTVGGCAYELPTWEHPTDGSASSSLLPTPDTGLSPNGHGRRGGAAANGHQSGVNLDAIAVLLPTPAVNDMGAGKTPEQWDEWTARMQAKHGNGNGHGPSLAIEAARLLPTPVADHSRGLAQPGSDYASLPNVALSLLPTPTAQAAKHAGDDRGPGTLDDFNLWSMIGRIGAATPPPSADGSEPSDGQLPLLLSPDATDLD